ncbi:MAG TPA: hypothetical protein HPQ04_10670 [Rhodospirillaceae bacterium]|nr:hypothetical protein [Rhodospirillaceae bacterium]
MEPRQFSLILGNERLPLDLHAVAADAEGRLAGAKARDIAFRFTYRHIPLSVRIRAGDSPVVEIQGQIGPMPFSAESASARVTLTAVLAAANEHLGETFRVVGGRIRISGTVAPDNPVTAVGLVTALTAFLLPRKPYLTIIDSVLAQLAAGPPRRPRQRAGMAKT